MNLATAIDPEPSPEFSFKYFGGTLADEMRADEIMVEMNLTKPSSDFEVFVSGGRRAIWKIKVAADDTTSAARIDGNENRKIDTFLETVYVLSAAGEVRQALDVIFQTISKILTNGNFSLCDSILTQVKVDRLTSALMVGFLSITLSSKRSLQVRPALYANIYAKLLHERGPERTAKLLKKYE
jgi:hypothetical protein